MRKVALSALLLVSASAAANPCVTSSRGLSFFSNAGGTNASSNDAVWRCESNRFTMNTECRTNLRCGYGVTDPYFSGRVRCTAASRGLVFDSVDRRVDEASWNAVQACQSSRFTVNSECISSLQCADAREFGGIGGGIDGGMNGAQMACSTSSRGMNFFAEGTTTTASERAVADCQSNRFTVNSECVANLQCTAGMALPRSASCSTQSRGLSFMRRGGDINRISNEVVMECQSNRFTNNAECSANIRCDYDAVIPAPVVPAPVVTEPAPVPSAGRMMCEVRTLRGVYTGFGETQELGIAEARRECLRVEQPFSCHRQSTARCFYR